MSHHGSHPILGDNVISAHQCLAVPDLSIAIEEFSCNLGTEFRDAEVMHFRMESSRGEVVAQPLKVCFSADFHLELVEVTDVGVFGSSVGAGLHHFGVVVQDIERALADCAATGLAVDWRLSLDSSEVAIATFFEASTGRTRLEIVDGEIEP